MLQAQEQVSSTKVIIAVLPKISHTPSELWVHVGTIKLHSVTFQGTSKTLKNSFHKNTLVYLVSSPGEHNGALRKHTKVKQKLKSNHFPSLWGLGFFKLFQSTLTSDFFSVIQAKYSKLFCNAFLKSTVC